MSLLQTAPTLGFTNPPHGPPLFFASDVSTRKQASLSSTVTLSNSTAETALVSLTMPALTFVTQGGGRLWVAGTARNSTNAARTVTYRGKLTIGATTTTIFATTHISMVQSTKPRQWQAAIGVVGTTLSTQLRTWGALDLSGASTISMPPTTYSGASYLLATVPNSSAATVFKLTAQVSAASTRLKVTADAGYLES